MKPSTAFVADPPVIIPVVLLINGDVDMASAEEPKLVDAVTVIAFELGEVNVGTVIPTAIVDVPMFAKLNPDPVKSAKPLIKLDGALVDPKLVGFVVVTVNALLMLRSLLLLTSVASKIGCCTSATTAEAEVEGC